MRDRNSRTSVAPIRVVSILILPTLLLTLLVAAAPASATAIYGYTGAPLYPPIFHLERVQGFLVFAEPLQPDMPFQDVTSLVTYSLFRDGGNVYPTGGAHETFSVRTNAAGDIVEWSFFVTSYGSSGCQSPGPCTLSSSGSPIGGSDTVRMWDESFPVASADSSSPGTWLTGVPEPSAALLSLVGFVSLSAIRRRSAQIRASRAPASI